MRPRQKAPGRVARASEAKKWASGSYEGVPQREECRRQAAIRLSDGPAAGSVLESISRRAGLSNPARSLIGRKRLLGKVFDLMLAAWQTNLTPRIRGPSDRRGRLRSCCRLEPTRLGTMWPSRRC